MRKYVILFTAVIVMSVQVNAMATNLLINGDVETGWGYTSPTDYHVIQSMTGNGKGGTGNALSYGWSYWDTTGCWLNSSTENALASGTFIPNNSTVYVGTWLKVSADFDDSGWPNTGLEVRLKVASPFAQEEYWSNSAANSVNSLFFTGDGWADSQGHSTIKSSNFSTEWKYFEFPVQVGNGGADGWNYVVLSVTDRVIWRGDWAGNWDGTIYMDDFYVGTTSQIPEPITLALMGLGGLLISRRK